jgi:hypothetical protein
MLMLLAGIVESNSLIMKKYIHACANFVRRSDF